MRIQIIIFILIIELIAACQSNIDKSKKAEFKLPEITNSQFVDTLKSVAFKADFVSEVFPIFGGKYKFQDKIDINPENRDSTIYKDFISNYSQIRLGDSLDVNGFELIVDYKTSVKYNRYYKYDTTLSLYNHYPVYFVNSTNSDKIFLAKDSYVFGIQEALDKRKYGNWRPIEGRGFDFCGNGRWGLIVHPQEFVLVLMRKYEGNFKTEMRVRFKVGENIFVSKPFKGIINKNQFTIQDSSYLKRRLQETDGKAANWLFYGAIPKKEEWVVKTF